MKKRFLFTFLGLFFLLSNSFLCAQKIDPKIETTKEQLNAIREALSVNQLTEDLTLNKVSKLIEKEKLHDVSKEHPNLNYLREILRENHFFDYNVKYYEINIHKIEDFTPESIKKNKDLYETLINSDYNKLGININEVPDGYNISLLLSQNFIEFDKEFVLQISFGEGKNSDRRYIKISGISYLNEIYYQTYANKEVDFVNAKPLKEKDIFLQENNRFELKFNVTENRNDKPNSVAFVDAKGEIVAFVTF